MLMCVCVKSYNRLCVCVVGEHFWAELHAVGVDGWNPEPGEGLPRQSVGGWVCVCVCVCSLS